MGKIKKLQALKGDTNLLEVLFFSWLLASVSAVVVISAKARN